MEPTTTACAEPALASEAPFLASFRADARLLLTPAPNGGWVVANADSYRAYAADRAGMPETLGAFGNALEMIQALAKALCPLKAVSDTEG